MHILTGGLKSQGWLWLAALLVVAGAAADVGAAGWPGSEPGTGIGWPGPAPGPVPGPLPGPMPDGDLGPLPDPVATPEPATVVTGALGLGLAGFWAVRNRLRRKAK